jgi:hypothetical protein
MLASRSAWPVSSVSTRSAGPATARQACPARSPYRLPVGPRRARFGEAPRGGKRYRTQFGAVHLGEQPFDRDAGVHHQRRHRPRSSRRIRALSLNRLPAMRRCHLASRVDTSPMGSVAASSRTLLACPWSDRPCRLATAFIELCISNGRTGPVESGHPEPVEGCTGHGSTSSPRPARVSIRYAKLNTRVRVASARCRTTRWGRGTSSPADPRIAEGCREGEGVPRPCAVSRLPRRGRSHRRRDSRAGERASSRALARAAGPEARPATRKEPTDARSRISRDQHAVRSSCAVTKRPAVAGSRWEGQATYGRASRLTSFSQALPTLPTQLSVPLKRSWFARQAPHRSPERGEATRDDRLTCGSSSDPGAGKTGQRTCRAGG